MTQRDQDTLDRLLRLARVGSASSRSFTVLERDALRRLDSRRNLNISTREREELADLVRHHLAPIGLPADAYDGADE